MYSVQCFKLCTSNSPLLLSCQRPSVCSWGPIKQSEFGTHSDHITVGTAMLAWVGEGASFWQQWWETLGWFNQLGEPQETRVTQQIGHHNGAAQQRASQHWCITLTLQVGESKWGFTNWCIIAMTFQLGKWQRCCTNCCLAVVLCNVVHCHDSPNWYIAMQLHSNAESS